MLKKFGKNFSPEFRSYSTQGRKFRKKQQKNYKTSFWHYFQPKRDEIGRERRKKILAPNSVHTRPRQENSEKNSKKIQKIKEPLSDIIYSQHRMLLAQREKKKFQSRIPFKQDPGKKISERIAKKFKKLKNVFPSLFFAKTG